MAVQEQRTLPPKFIEDLAVDYGKQLTALTAQPIDTSKFAPTIAAQDPLQTQAATLAQSGIGAYQPFVTAAQQAATDFGTGITAAQQLTGTGAGTGAGSIASFMSPYQQQVIDATRAEFDQQAAKSRLGFSMKLLILEPIILSTSSNFSLSMYPYPISALFGIIPKVTR